jgi:hypothetical protein
MRILIRTGLLALLLTTAGCGTEEQADAERVSGDGGMVDFSKYPVPAGDPIEAVIAFRAAAADPVRGLSRQGSHAIPVLIYLMTGDDTATAIAAAEEAVRIGPDSIPALISVLRSKSPRGRGWAAWALGELGPAAKDARKALTAAQSDPELRVSAGEALRKIGE